MERYLVFTGSIGTPRIVIPNWDLPESMGKIDRLVERAAQELPRHNRADLWLERDGAHILECSWSFKDPRRPVQRDLVE